MDVRIHNMNVEYLNQKEEYEKTNQRFNNIAKEYIKRIRFQQKFLLGLLLFNILLLYVGIYIELLINICFTIISITAHIITLETAEDIVETYNIVVSAFKEYESQVILLTETYGE